MGRDADVVAEINEGLVSPARHQVFVDLCAHLFKDFQFGLSLIKKNTGRKQFVLDREAIEAPDKFLSELVLRSYGPGGDRPAG